MEATMKYSPTTQPQFIAEMCADLVDVLSDSVDSESLHALLSIFLEISGAQSGAAFTVDLTNEIDEGIALSQSSGTLTRSMYSTASYVAQRSLRTLQNEFSVTSSSSHVNYEYAFPLRVRGRAIGAVVLQMSDSHLLTEEIVSLLQSVTDLAASTIDHTHQVLQNRTLATQLQNALNSRIILEQAKGVLAERSKTDCISAFGELRQMARRAQLPIHQVASEIIANVGLEQPVHSSVHSDELSASVA
jgi:hypothetical protein